MISNSAKSNYLGQYKDTKIGSLIYYEIMIQLFQCHGMHQFFGSQDCICFLRNGLVKVINQGVTLEWVV